MSIYIYICNYIYIYVNSVVPKKLGHPALFPSLHRDQLPRPPWPHFHGCHGNGMTLCSSEFETLAARPRAPVQAPWPEN